MSHPLDKGLVGKTVRVKGKTLRVIWYEVSHGKTINITMQGIKPEHWWRWEEQYLVCDDGSGRTVYEAHLAEAERRGQTHNLPKPVTVQFTSEDDIEILA